MNREELEKNLLEAVREYIEDEECFDDNAQLQINTSDGSIALLNSDEVTDGDSAVFDYYDVMDLLEMDANGTWKPDAEAIRSIVEEY